MLRIGFVILMGLSMVNCAERDIDKIGEAQECLDDATQDNVSKCVEIVDGLDSDEANLIRCSAQYISIGFNDSSTYEQVFSALGSDSSSDDNAILAVAPVLAFSTTDEASTTQGYCDASGSAGLQLLAGLSVIATTLGQVGDLLSSISDGTASAEDFEAVISDWLSGSDASTEDTASVGAAIDSINSSYCTDNGTSSEDFCSDLSEAVDDSACQAETGTKAVCTMNFDYDTQLVPDTPTTPLTSDQSETDRQCCRFYLGILTSNPGSCDTNLCD